MFVALKNMEELHRLYDSDTPVRKFLIQKTHKLVIAIAAVVGLLTNATRLSLL